MNSVTIDVDMLDSLPAKTMLRLTETNQMMRRNLTKFADTVKAHAAMFRRLEEMDIEPRFDLSSYGSIDLIFTGDGPRLAAVWGELRRSGYAPSSHPKKGDTSASVFFEPSNSDDAKIYVNFSSSVCKRVQVGTEMKEVPIYETRCDELTGIEHIMEPAQIAQESTP